jgi:hypothetical protein
MTLKSHIDKINPGDNVIIGLGDSFTQGVGAYSNETWAAFSKPVSMHNITGQLCIIEQAQNNWVRQLRDHFYSNYKILNLGVNGAGNRAAVKELYLNSLPPDVGDVIVILLSTGLERFDFLKNERETSGPQNHQKWLTIFPSIDSSRGNVAQLELAYAKTVWSRKTSSVEYLLNVADAQAFCKSKNYKFFFSTVFDKCARRDELLLSLEEYKNLIDIVDWSDCLTVPGNDHIMDYVCKLENHPKITNFQNSGDFIRSLDMPLTYITPCCHWTPKGNFEVAKLLHQLLVSKDAA